MKRNGDYNLRVVTGIPVVIAGWMLPTRINVLGNGGSGLICVWLWLQHGTFIIFVP